MNGNNDKCKLRDFCFAADENYTMPLRVCVASLLWSMRPSVKNVSIHVLDIGIPDAKWEETVLFWRSLVSRINGGESKDVEFVRHEISREKFKGFMLWHGSVATYARLLLPDILPETEWCMYSDCDVLFISSPLELESYCDNGNVCVWGHKNPPAADAVDSAWFKSRGLEFNSNSYVCGGLLLMNLRRLEEIGFTRKAMEFLCHHKVTASADQCAINHICAGDVRLLPREWGVFNEEITTERGGAIHYADAVPWRMPVNGTSLLGSNPDISRLWRRFAVEVCGLDPKMFSFRLKDSIGVRTRALMIWSYLLVSRTLRFKPWKYANWPGKNIDRKAVASYFKLLLGEKPA